MKKVSFCIGVFMVLFLAFGVYAAPPQGDLRDFDGTWLKLTVKPQKGLEFTGYNSTDAPAKMKAGALNIYACMDVNDPGVANGEAFLRLFKQDGTAIGYGTLKWDAGTNLEFLGYLDAFIATNVTYTSDIYGYPSGGDVTDIELYGYVSVKGKAVDKIKIQSVSGEGYIQAPDATDTTGAYAGFGYILNGGFTKDRKVPQIIPACGDLSFIF
jgi:hypothetical protein